MHHEPVVPSILQVSSPPAPHTSRSGCLSRLENVVFRQESTYLRGNGHGSDSATSCGVKSRVRGWLWTRINVSPDIIHLSGS